MVSTTNNMRTELPYAKNKIPWMTLQITPKEALFRQYQVIDRTLSTSHSGCKIVKVF